MGKHSIKHIKTLRLGVIGTAKNTGKTTTLIALMQEAHKRHIPLAVTGIGYDGEAIDNLTLLPKPRLDVFPGIQLATAEECVSQATARFKILEKTEEETSLGKIRIVETISPGRVLLVGPNKSDALDRVLARLEKRVPLVLIDGALGRMVPICVADTVIFATGASRSTNIAHLAREMKAIQGIFSLEGFENTEPVSEMPDAITLYYLGNRKNSLDFSSLLAKEHAQAILSLWHKDLRQISIPGAVASTPLQWIIDQAPGLKNLAFHFRSPAMLLAGGKPLIVFEKLQTLAQKGAKIVYQSPLPILAVTINPFYPKQKGRRGLFEPAYVDEFQMIENFLSALSLPVYNIVKQGAESLFDLIPLNKGGTKA